MKDEDKARMRELEARLRQFEIYFHEHDALQQREAGRIDWLFRWDGINAIFRRGTLAVMEICGIVLLVRSIILVVDFDLWAGILGATLLVIGSIIEFLTWRTAVMASRLPTENERMRMTLERALAGRPKGI